MRTPRMDSTSIRHHALLQILHYLLKGNLPALPHPKLRRFEMAKIHDQGAAIAWGHGGAAYDFISFGLSDGISLAVQALWPDKGERILDLGTGTGWTARLCAQQGADVVGGDISETLLAAAKGLSKHLSDRLTFQLADAEALPFADHAFDGVISTYGVIFSGRPQMAASELARVVRPGGKLVLLTWLEAENGYIPEFFQMIGKYSDAPPPETSPLSWGNPDWIQELLGNDWNLVCEPLTTSLYAPNAEVLWEKYKQGFGPVGLTADHLSAERHDAFRQDFLDLHAPWDTGSGLKIDRRALLVRGTRRT